MRLALAAAAIFFLVPSVGLTQTFAPPQASAQAPQPTDAAVEVVDSFHLALKSGDASAVLALMADDVVVLEEGGAERSREEYASHHLRSDMAFAAATDTEVSRRATQIEGDVAWVLTEGRTTGRFNERAVDRRTAETMILQRTDQGWVIRHIHWSSRASN